MSSKIFKLSRVISLPINKNLLPTSTGYVPPFEFGIKGRGAYDYEWIYVISCIFAFICAAGIGANDVANSFATSVGSKTLKMWQAILIASICEFLGAYLLGARVTATIRSGIVSVDAFEGHDDLLMFGMCVSIFVVGGFLFLATHFELPVSTTHSIIGAIVGFALCSPQGASAVQWGEIGKIIASWFVSPLLTCIISGLFFALVRGLILRRENSLDRVFIFFPILVFVTITLNVIFILFKGGVTKGQGISGASITEAESLGISFGVGAGCALLCALYMPRLRRYIKGLTEEDLILFAANNGNLAFSEKDQQRLLEIQAERARKAAEEEAAAERRNENVQTTDIIDPAAAAAANADAKAGKDVADDIENRSVGTASSSTSSIRKIGRFERRLDKMFSQELVHNSANATANVSAIHENAEVFPMQTEFAFGYLQVTTACFASFAHGANDVSNSIGPLAAVYAIYTGGVGAAAKSAPVPDWILVLGGLGIVFGLAVYGHIIIAAIGVKMVKITPARGFAAELSVALVITVGSFLGLPLSSTHCAVGAIIGLGVVERRKDAVNWKLLSRIFAGWVFTLVVAGSMSAAVFSWSTFAPSQIYPLSLHNCMNFYGQVRNATKGDPTVYTIQMDSSGTIIGFFAYPANGTVVNL